MDVCLANLRRLLLKLMQSTGSSRLHVRGPAGEFLKTTALYLPQVALHNLSSLPTEHPVCTILFVHQVSFLSHHGWLYRVPCVWSRNTTCRSRSIELLINGKTLIMWRDKSRDETNMQRMLRTFFSPHIMKPAIFKDSALCRKSIFRYVKPYGVSCTTEA